MVFVEGSEKWLCLDKSTILKENNILLLNIYTPPPPNPYLSKTGTIDKTPLK